MDSTIISAIIGTVVPFYVAIMICSTFLNGIIVVMYARVKELHTPSILLQVHLSFIGLIIPFCYSPFTLAAFVSVMLSCDCTILYYHWLFGNVLHFWGISFFYTSTEYQLFFDTQVQLHCV